MIKLSITILCMALLASCSYHAYTKKDAIKVAKKRDSNKDGSIVIVDKDRTLEVLTRDSNYQQVDEIYQFNEKGKQLKYSMLAKCDSCYQQYITKEMKSPYKWRQLNDTTFLSAYNFKSILHIHPATFSYDIEKHNMDKAGYKSLVKSIGK